MSTDYESGDSRNVYEVTASNSTIGACAQGPNSQAHALVINYGVDGAQLLGAIRSLEQAVVGARDRNIEEMVRISVAVVESLASAKTVSPADRVAAVADYLHQAVEDPAFSSRAARLFQEGAKTPSPARKEMLARALFGIPPTTPARDRVDAAIERLFPDDVALLRDLAGLLKKHAASHLFIIEDRTTRSLFAVQPGFEMRRLPDVGERLPIANLPLYSLQTAGCVEFGPWIDTFGPERDAAGTGLSVLPLGFVILESLQAARLNF